MRGDESLVGTPSEARQSPTGDVMSSHNPSFTSRAIPAASDGPCRSTPGRPISNLPVPGLLMLSLLLLSLPTAAALAAGSRATTSGEHSIEMPWRQAGLTERQAAAHLLDRFTYGPRPGEVDRLVEMGLERWFEQQLAGDIQAPDLDNILGPRPTLEMTALELASRYPQPGRVLMMAVEDGVVERDVLDDEGQETDRRDPEMRHAVKTYAREQGFKPQREALADLMIQKLAHARYSENQLQEMLTDFWFNHFNVSLTDNQARIYLWPYERDAIRPHVVGSFRDMLSATAHHPAMLLYLDNARSVAKDGVTTTLDVRFAQATRGHDRLRRRRGFDPRGRRRASGENDLPERRATGPNENYARELMELHTLGVDGGFGQDDVVDVARAFTGWTLIPPAGLPERLQQTDERRRRRMGFVIDGPFLFRADAHDAERKEVLGHWLPAGRGVEDGEEVLNLLAAHPSTARHLTTKLAVRFVSDEPPESLVDRLAKVFLGSSGDLRKVMVALVESPEFWSQDALGKKIKSPFEVVMSALRALDARPRNPRSLVDWIRRMGQPLYAYQAPTGYPDRAEAWVNTGALLQRMNFGLQLATNRVPGVQLDLEESDSMSDVDPSDLTTEALLRLWLPRLLPERDPEPTIRRLLPMASDPTLATRIAESTPDDAMADGDETTWNPLSDDDDLEPERRPKDVFWTDSPGPDASRRGRWRRGGRAAPSQFDDSVTAQVVGVILGSPEFQRR